MPRAFDETERTTIRERLMTAGLQRFSAQGIRATRVDDIARDAGIAKGSFYAFFPSKEDLFMSVADARDIGHKEAMREWLRHAVGDPVTLLGSFFDLLMQQIETDPVLRIVRDSGELSHLTRRIAPERLRENARRDADFVVEISELLRDRHKVGFADPHAIEGLMVLMLSLSMQSELIAASADYPAAVRLLKSMFISRLWKGPADDQG
ncbi:MAG TPA: TetR/AcrR family transcriptional regulator [Devosiaceae bacterium]